MAVIVIAAASILTMPVSYTGGRDVSHPHAFIQLFFDAARGSMSHHRADDGHPHVDPPPRAFLLAEVPDGTPLLTQTGGSSERVALLSMALTTGLWLLLGRLPMVDPSGRFLAGRTVGPDIPPPRRLALP